MFYEWGIDAYMLRNFTADNGRKYRIAHVDTG